MVLIRDVSGIVALKEDSTPKMHFLVNCTLRSIASAPNKVVCESYLTNVFRVENNRLLEALLKIKGPMMCPNHDFNVLILFCMSIKYPTI